MDPDSPTASGSAPDVPKGTETDGPPGRPGAADASRAEDRGDPFRTALEALHLGVFVQDAQGRLLASNSAAERILGVHPSQLAGGAPRPPGWTCVREDGSALPEEELPSVLALRTGQPRREALLGVSRPGGALTWLRVQADPVFGPGETVPRAVVCSFSDITGMQHDRAAQERARENAEEEARVKDKFVSLLAHDLRGPIAAAMSMVGLVATDQTPGLAREQREALEAVIARLGQQLELIDDVLNITRLRSGKLRVRRRKVTAGVVLAPIAGLVFTAQRKGVRLVNEIRDDAGMAADPVLFGQVLQNLVSNAIKFTNPGGTVRIFIPPGRPGAIAVQDSGIGIEPGRVGDLFRADVRTTTVGTGGERGTGMGLPLSHDIVAAHGGTLRVESVAGQGTTVTAELPPHRPVVLVVDDEADLRALFKRYLQRQGCEVVEAENGEQALALLKTIDANLIVTDVQMPRLDGFGLLDAVRRNPDTGDTPVIVVTVGTDVETRDRAFALGANDFVTKPLAPHDFLPRVRRFLY